MLGNAFGWPHLIIILVVILLLFGAPKLPGLAKSLGQSMRIFRKEVSTMKEEKAADDKRPDADEDGSNRTGFSDVTGSQSGSTSTQSASASTGSTSTDARSTPNSTGTTQPKP